MKRILFLMAIAIMLGISVQSCREMGIDPWDKGGNGGGNGGGDPIDSTITVMPVEKLVGTKWQLTTISYNGRNEIATVPNDKLVSLNFDSPVQVSGMNLCTGYNAMIKSAKPGDIHFKVGVTTLPVCDPVDIHQEYFKGLNSATSYTTTNNELRINYTSVSIDAAGVNTSSSNTLIFVPLKSKTDDNGNGTTGADLVIKQMAGHTYTLHSFVNANSEEVLSDAGNCSLAIGATTVSQKGMAALNAGCNSGTADVTFGQDGKTIKFDNIALTEMACPNPMTADRYVQFLKNTSTFELSDYGTTITIWSSLNSFAESKMVMKVVQTPVVDPTIIEIQETSSTGVPTSTYPMFYVDYLKFDGKYINIGYQYGNLTTDFKISAYSPLQFQNGTPTSVVVDLVTDGTPNPMNSLVKGQALLSLDAIRKRILIASPNKTSIDVRLRWSGQELGVVQVVL